MKKPAHKSKPTKLPRRRYVSTHRCVFKFKHGGCLVHPRKEMDRAYPADDYYECECGLSLIVKSPAEIHQILPDKLDFSRKKERKS